MFHQAESAASWSGVGQSNSIGSKPDAMRTAPSTRGTETAVRLRSMGQIDYVAWLSSSFFSTSTLAPPAAASFRYCAAFALSPFGSTIKNAATKAFEFGSSFDSQDSARNNAMLTGSSLGA